MIKNKLFEIGKKKKITNSSKKIKIFPIILFIILHNKKIINIK